MWMWVPASTERGDRAVCPGAPGAAGVIAIPMAVCSIPARTPGTLRTRGHRPGAHPCARLHRGCERGAGGGNRRPAYARRTRFPLPGPLRLTALSCLARISRTKARERKGKRRARSFLNRRSRHRRKSCRWPPAGGAGIGIIWSAPRDSDTPSSKSPCPNKVPLPHLQPWRGPGLARR